MPSLLHIRATGTNRDVGLVHGRLAKEKIHGSIGSYRAYFQLTAKLDWDQVHLKAAEFARSIQTGHPDLYEEMEGIAEGSGLDVLDIVALNVRSEIALTTPLDGCTAFSWQGRDKSQWAGQNWDWQPSLKDCLCLLDIDKYEPTGRPAMKFLTEAGIIGKIGLNSCGVCVLINAIRTSFQNTAYIPVHLALRRILERNSVDEAVAYMSTICSSRTAAAAHILVADPAKSVGIEISPLGMALLAPDGFGFIRHTNHLLALQNTGERMFSESVVRLETVEALTLAAEARGEVPSHEAYKRILSDRSGGTAGICRSDGINPGGCDTLFSISVDCGKKQADIIMGKPDEDGKRLILEF